MKCSKRNNCKSVFIWKKKSSADAGDWTQGAKLKVQHAPAPANETRYCEAYLKVFLLSPGDGRRLRFSCVRKLTTRLKAEVALAKPPA